MGSITGRYIGENIRLLRDIINEKSDDSVIMLLDQEKPLIEWSGIGYLKCYTDLILGRNS